MIIQSNKVCAPFYYFNSWNKLCAGLYFFLIRLIFLITLSSCLKTVLPPSVCLGSICLYFLGAIPGGEPVCVWTLVDADWCLWRAPRPDVDNMQRAVACRPPAAPHAPHHPSTSPRAPCGPAHPYGEKASGSSRECSALTSHGLRAPTNVNPMWPRVLKLAVN